MKNTFIYTIAVVSFLFVNLPIALSQNDTTEVNVGKKKIIIIGNTEKDKERVQTDLEAGKQAFQDLLDGVADKNASLKLEIIELKDSLVSASEGSKDSLKILINEKQKQVSENEKKIEAFESGIAGIEEDLDNLKNDSALDDNNGNKHSFSFKKKHRRFTGHWAGFQLGLTNFLNANQQIANNENIPYLELAPEKSVGYQLNFIKKSIPLISNKGGIVTGVGVEWNSFSLLNNVDLYVDGNGQIAGNLVDPNNRSYEKNRLNMAYLTIPILFEVQPWGKKSFFASVGVTGGVKLWSNQKQTYYTGDHKNKYKNRNSFQLNPFRYGATAKIGYHRVAIYANYNVSQLFKTNKGPELYPFTVGVSFINF